MQEKPGFTQNGQNLQDLSDENKRLKETIAKLESEKQGLLQENQQLHGSLQDYLECKAKNQAMFKQSSVGMAFFDLRGKFLDANPAIIEVAGYSLEELLAKTFQDITHPEDQETGVVQFFEMLEGKTNHYSVNRRYIHKNGSVLHCISTISIVNIPGKPEPIVLAQIVNVSEARMFKQELADIEKKHRLAMEVLKDGLWDWDVKSGHVYYSPAWGEILGEFDPTPDYGYWEARIHPNDRDQALRTLAEHVEGETPVWIHEHRLRTSQNTWKWVKGRGRVVERDHDGAPLRMVGTMTDIDERKQVESSLYKTSRILEETIRQAPYATRIVEGDTDNPELFIENETAANFIGGFLGGYNNVHDDKDILKCRLHLMDDHTPIDPDMRPLPRAFKGEEIRNERFMLLTDRGELVPVEVSAFPVYGKDGNIMAVSITLFDISKKIEMEKELLHAHKMEAVGTLAGGVSHDFNNILGIIVGHAELAADDIPEGNPAHENIQAILEACLRARDVVRQLLSYARKTEFEQQPLKTTPIIQDSIKLLRASIPSSIEISTSLEATQDMIMADPSQVKQVLFNLCTNAANAIKKTGGSISIRTSNTPFPSALKATGGANGREYLLLVVEDSGEGMTPDVAGRALEPYFTTREVGEGSGMGLAVVHGIVQSWGGKMQIDSQPGAGTRMEILVPVHLKESWKTSNQHEARPVKGAERILIVDDEQSLITTEKAILNRLGYSVTAETDSEKALETFRAHPHNFDLVMTDMTMPKMSGEELAAKLKEIRPDIPIILCSGFASKTGADALASAGVNAVMTKPMTKKDISQMVRKVLDS